GVILREHSRYSSPNDYRGRLDRDLRPPSVAEGEGGEEAMRGRIRVICFCVLLMQALCGSATAQPLRIDQAIIANHATRQVAPAAAKRYGRDAPSNTYSSALVLDSPSGHGWGMSSAGIPTSGLQKC